VTAANYIIVQNNKLINPLWEPDPTANDPTALLRANRHYGNSYRASAFAGSAPRNVKIINNQWSNFITKNAGNKRYSNTEAARAFNQPLPNQIGPNGITTSEEVDCSTDPNANVQCDNNTRIIGPYVDGSHSIEAVYDMYCEFDQLLSQNNQTLGPNWGLARHNLIEQFSRCGGNPAYERFFVPGDVVLVGAASSVVLRSSANGTATSVRVNDGAEGRVLGEPVGEWYQVEFYNNALAPYATGWIHIDNLI
jgi:hypothetical protein